MTHIIENAMQAPISFRPEWKRDKRKRVQPLPPAAVHVQPGCEAEVSADLFEQIKRQVECAEGQGWVRVRGGVLSVEPGADEVMA